MPAERFAALDLLATLVLVVQADDRVLFANASFEDVMGLSRRSLHGADAAEQQQIRKLILDSVAGDIELRSKKELIEKFIEQNLPNVGDAAEIPETFESFWEVERVAAFERLVKEEQLDADKLKKVIDRYVYTGKEPLPDPDIIDLIIRPLKLSERAPTRKRVLEKIMDYVLTFIQGIAA